MTSTLPASLAPWQHLLELFSDEVRPALGAWVRRLALAIGPLRTKSERGAGEPDGFDGLHRRGSYERLLVSEWLMLDEAPLEFTRRAAAGEHAFLRVARREPARARSSVVLIDAGPSQLGAPRIAHLALLIVMAQRAEAAGARFGWGVAQEPHHPLRPAITPASVEHLFAARTHQEITPLTLEAWHARLKDTGALDDAWLVASERSARLASLPEASRVTVTDVLDPFARALRVGVCERGREPKRLELELPADPLCARLLRDPFEHSAVAKPAVVRRDIAPTSNALFSANGGKLIARAGRDAVVTIPVPNSPRAPMGRPKLHALNPWQQDLGRVVVAAGYQRKRLLLVTANERRLRVHSGSRDAEDYAVFTEEPFRVATERDPLRPCLEAPPSPVRVPKTYVQDADGALFQCDTATRDAGVISPRATAIARTGSELAYVGRTTELMQSGGASPWCLTRVTHDEIKSVPLAGDGTFEAHFGCGNAQGPYGEGVLAVQQYGALWRILLGNRVESTQVPAGSRVIGVATLSDGLPVLVALEGDGRGFLAVSPRGEKRVCRAAAPVAHATVSAAQPMLAYTTTRGETSLIWIETGASLGRLLVEG